MIFSLSKENKDRWREIDADLSYLRRGWSVLPLCPPDHVGVGLANRNRGKKCKNPGKVPWISWGEYQDLLPTEDEIRHWWQLLPNSNLGLALGPISGAVRLDVEGEAAHQQLLDIS